MLVWLLVAFSTTVGSFVGWISFGPTIKYPGATALHGCLFCIFAANMSFWPIWFLWLSIKEYREKIPFEKISILPVLLLPVFIAIHYFWPHIWPGSLGHKTVIPVPIAGSLFSIGAISAVCGIFSGIREAYGFALLLMNLAIGFFGLMPVFGLR